LLIRLRAGGDVSATSEVLAFLQVENHEAFATEVTSAQWLARRVFAWDALAAWGNQLSTARSPKICI